MKITSALKQNAEDPTVFDFDIDNSSKDRLETCPRSAAYYILRRRESNVDRAALFFGKVIHSALEPRKRGEENWLGKAYSIIADAYADNPVDMDEWRTPEHAIAAMTHYATQYPVELEDFEYVPGTIETPFRIPIGEVEMNCDIVLYSDEGVPQTFFCSKVNVFWTGRIDGIIKRNGIHMVLDHKTTSMMGPSFWADFQISAQMHGYTWAGQKLGYDIAGLYLDGLGIRKPSKTGKQFEYDRRPYFYEQDEIDEWERDMFTSVVQFFEFLRRDYFPKFTKWCHGKYGSCEFFNTCCAPARMRDSLLYSDSFREVTWSPLND